MSNIKNSIAELVGHTPLLRLNGFETANGAKAEIIAKLEFFNPNQSIKDRTALRILQDAEKDGRLHDGLIIAEASSGNTGIGLAGLAAAKGYPFRAYIPGRVSKERFEVVSAFGAEIVKIEDVPAMVNALKDSNNDFFAGVTALKQSLRDDKELFFSDQAFNESNVKAHHDTTGPEIWEDTDGNVDIAVISVGTGGTITGIGSFLKEQDPDIKIVAVEPIIVNDKDGKPKEITGVHRFSDVEERCKPGILNEGIIDEIIEVDPFVACKTAQLAARTDGILVGESSGAAFYAAAQLAKRPENEGKRIVAIAPDTGLRYLSTGLFEKEAE